MKRACFVGPLACRDCEEAGRLSAVFAEEVLDWLVQQVALLPGAVAKGGARHAFTASLLVLA